MGCPGGMRTYESLFFLSHFPFVHFSCLLCLFCLKKRLSKDQWGFDINFCPRSCNRFWTKWILVKKNLKISKTSKQRSLTFNEYQLAGRRRGVPDSHIIETGMLLGKLELKRLRSCTSTKYYGVWLFYLDISLPTALRGYTHLGLTEQYLYSPCT